MLRLVPREVTLSAREQPSAAVERPLNGAMAAGIVAIWIVLAGVLGPWAWAWLRT